MGAELKEKFRVLREEGLGWTQRQMAEVLGVTETTVRAYEHERHAIATEHLVKLGKLAGAPDCWYWWGLAGLKEEDVLAVLPDSSTRPAVLKKAAEIARRLGHGKQKRDRAASGE